MNLVSMSRKAIGAKLRLYIKNQRKTEFGARGLGETMILNLENDALNRKIIRC